MDSIEITGIRCYGYTGYLPEEQTLGQWFEVDLVLWLDLAPAAKTDGIEDTFDYRKAIATVKEIIKTSKFALIETLVNAIADAILALDKVEKVQLKLSKLAAPIPDFGGKITLNITRS
ncbi:dihydroneopterin aldolase [Xenococcus sp. PCC 7305]|uniref:dihydroneopterin aldolase n=1 Tax=Xenococcus sp. PCC 7305 TaxID=102125 RepID=UPI0002ACD71C|nr:dihydroneopterin aldolase [Xenococcus sp. PCC 7305]ELS04182.1 dihydroneopterin aldolase [Xenococcus sp. PCC 7305]